MSHAHAVKENLKFFTEDFVKKYDTVDSSIKLRNLVPQILLQYPDIKSILDASPLPNDHPLANDLPLPQTSPIFKPDKVLLDFACGTGTVTERFKPYVGKIIGIDINEAMLKMFSQRLPEAEVACLDILSEDVSHLTNSVDIIICTISYHHLDNYEAITAKLSEFLRPGGHLFILDFYNDDLETPRQRDAKDAESEAVRHMGGLRKESLTRTFEAAGLGEIFADKVAELEIWHGEDFIKYHCSQKVYDSIGLLPSRQNDITEYLIKASLVLAVGKK